jgi:hypothetical protein
LLPWIFRQLRAAARPENISQFRQRSEDVDEAQPRHRAAHEIVGDQRAQAGDGLGKIIPIPERRPGNQDEQQACFEQQGDKQQASEQAVYPLA